MPCIWWNMHATGRARKGKKKKSWTKRKITDLPKLNAFFTSGRLIATTVMNWRGDSMLVTAKMNEGNETYWRLEEHPDQHESHTLYPGQLCKPVSKTFPPHYWIRKSFSVSQNENCGFIKSQYLFSRWTNKLLVQAVFKQELPHGESANYKWLF